ncbi:hypothetical protein N7492_008741 [Penicillium capsulatum]|uniref:Uncharacterized protein n=1 Tax=Penicillium capsulatum TaxID=69766 RepID=A0A9W9LH85_9EURO|nr:hypothetical protein N7492_008741 [Penicillium capsulatum]KAJ6106145.1 hypothetical protein N7512_009662 [Penicillium capsulatum]
MISSARRTKLPAHTAIILVPAPSAGPAGHAIVDDAIEHVLALLLVDRHFVGTVIAHGEPHALAGLAISLVGGIQPGIDGLSRKGAITTHFWDVVGVGGPSHNRSVAETGRALRWGFFAIAAGG